MPCSYGDGDCDHSHYKQQIDLVTRLLCELCDKVDLGAVGASSELTNWYLYHQAQDAKRLAAEAEVERQRLLKQRALDKLTPEERKVLKL